MRTLLPYQQQQKLASQRVLSKHDDYFLLTELAKQLLTRIAYLKFSPKIILDLGASFGSATELLRQTFPNAKIFGLDLVAPLSQKTAHFCLGDANQLPFARHSVDCIFANALLPVINDYESFWQECLRVLKPNGLFLFTTLGPNSLKELRESLAAFSHTDSLNVYVDMHDLGDSLLNAGFTDPALDAEIVELHYSSLKKLLHELKNCGSTKLWSDYPHLYPGKNFWLQVENFYRKHFSSEKDKLISSFEIYFGIAFAGEQRKMGGEGVSVAISSIKRRH